MFAKKNTGLFLLPLLWCFIVSDAFSYEISEDAAGASESAFFKRYPRSKIDDFKESATADYLLALSAPKTINGVMRLEYSERMAGMLTRITYRAPDNESSQQVFDHFRSQLSHLSYRLLFECHGRECGDSNEWANRIFEISKLYGPDRQQHYAAVQLNTENGPLLMALYTIQRGNKRVYAQLDFLQPNQNTPIELAVNPDAILAELKSMGVFNLRNLEFDKNDKLMPDSQQRLETVVMALKKNSQLKFYVVGHLTADESIDVLLARSLGRAESVIQVLVEQGINPQRFSAYGVGPLAPVERQGEDANRIGLVVRSGG